MPTAIAVAYVALSAVLTVHTAFQFWLWRATRRRRVRVRPSPSVPEDALPHVTVQLPIYNERYVVERLLDKVAALDYPHDRLVIQVVDDSTDDTVQLVAEKCRALADVGLAVEHVLRTQRTGYKAGALQHALQRVRGDVILVLDADFEPAPDVLRRMVGHFSDPRVAAVQARWEFGNRDETFLTRIQAFYIDVHFAVEQQGRSLLGCFVNFNGSAGLWRVDAIRAAGGWSDRTLTEDLDLSYRVQLAGWRIVYLDDVSVPGELPAEMSAFRQQQYRWMKGVAQNARRLTGPVVHASIPRRVKAHALAHLFESSNFVAISLVLLLSPIAAHAAGDGAIGVWVAVNPLWLVNAAFLAPVYFVPWLRRGNRGLVRGIALWVAFFAMITGMSLHNTLAVLDGLIRRGGEFVRTPKAGAGPAIHLGAYRVRHFDGAFPFEIALWLYLGGSIVRSAMEGTLLLSWIPFVGFIGLTWVILAGRRGACARQSQEDAAATRAG